MERKSKIKFVIQKTGAFCIIYAISAVLMEGMILLLLSGLGYDALHGKMPTEAWAGFPSPIWICRIRSYYTVICKMCGKKKVIENTISN